MCFGADCVSGERDLLFRFTTAATDASALGFSPFSALKSVSECWNIHQDLHGRSQREWTLVKCNSTTPTVHAETKGNVLAFPCNPSLSRFLFLELDNPEARVAEIHSIVHRLPEKNRQMLELLMKHLAKWVLGLTPLFIRCYKSNRAKDLRGLPL